MIKRRLSYYHDSPWYYKNDIVTFNDIKQYFGFVYQITDLIDNKKYIGKKFIWCKRKGVKKESNWSSYFSSHEIIRGLAKLTPTRFKREILVLCDTKGETNFREIEIIIKMDALWADNFYNENLLGRYFRKNIKNYFNKEFKELK